MTGEKKKAIEIVQGLKIYYDDECLLDKEEVEENKSVNNAIDTLINFIEETQKELEQEKEKNTELRIQISARETVVDELREKIEEIRDKAEVMDYYTLNDVIDDLTKLLEG